MMEYSKINTAQSRDSNEYQRRMLREFSPEHLLRNSGPLYGNEDSVIQEHTGIFKNEFSIPCFKSPKQASLKVESYISEQSFQGTVLSVDRAEKTFWARLVDIEDTPDEEAEIGFDEVSKDDWNLIAPGALFLWNIGRETRDRQTRRISEIRFRRLPGFSQDAIDHAKKHAAEITKLIEELRVTGIIDPT